MPTRTRIRDCPFCESDELEVDMDVGVCCQKCKACGPSIDDRQLDLMSEEEATEEFVRLWNDRKIVN